MHHPPLDASESHAGVSQGEAPRPGLESPIATQSPAKGPAPTGGTAVQLFEHALPSAQILFHTGTGAAAAALWVKKVHVQVFHLHSKHT